MCAHMAESKYLIDPETGNRFPIGGCLISQQPSTLPKFGSSRTLSNKELPSSVDLRQLMTPVVSQGDFNSCVANALAGSYEFLIMKNTKKALNISRLFIYYNGQKIDNPNAYKLEDIGTYLSSAVIGLKRFGCCKEEMFPHTSANLNKRPPEHCFIEAAKYKIKEALVVAVDLNEMRGCLAEGYPFAFGLETFQSFLRAGKNGGRVEMPNLYYEKQNQQHGWHAMLAVGYSDLSRCFIVRNSWGKSWGDNGYCYIPYEYMCNKDLCQDLHTIQLVDNDSTRRTTTDVVNPYDWNDDKNKPYYIPPNYPYQDFDFTFFWKLNDTFDYFSNLWNQGKTPPPVKDSLPTDDVIRPDRTPVLPKNEVQMSFILWIDKHNSENTHIEQRLTIDRDVKVDFCETYSKGEAHISRLRERIRSSSTFQVICRGYYRDENKNPLNLLQFLNNNGLSHIPVSVFTQDKSGLMNHLQRQGPAIGIYDWQQRLFITSSSEELITNINDKNKNKRYR
ncbi:unnamed protein product [Rotaria socialis]|uniref:Peptidase C1A papain C-terminal domain-containing protein n=2 Tax=Rotaria socialis TaxID=392032 RepID=A0A818SVJ2_9BILA|nr:unnamed protein product [Rotaria socialis]